MVEIMGGTISAATVPQIQQAQQQVEQQIAEQQKILAQKQQAEKQQRVESEKVHKLEYKPDAVAQPIMVHAAILPVGGGAVRVPVSSQSGGLF